MKKAWKKESRNGRDNNRLGKIFWKLKLEEKNRCGSKTGDKEKKNGKKS